MVSRRRTLALAAGALAGAAGCLGTPRSGTPSDTRRPSRTPTDATAVDDTPDREPRDTATPRDLPEWTPEWRLPLEGWAVLGLDVRDGLLYATLSGDGGPSAAAAVDPAGPSVLWRTRAEGEAVGRQYATHAEGGWGVTLAADAVYAVAGPAEEREWSAVHALDRASGARRWSLRRERVMGVAGVLDDTVVAVGEEFFPAKGETPGGSHHTPEEPLTTVVYGLAPGDGSVLWTRAFDGVGDVAVADGGVYVAAHDRLVGLDADGTTRFTAPGGPPLRVRATADRVFHLAGDHDAATLRGVAPGGGVDWTHDLPVDDVLLAGGRLYAAGDTVAAVDPDGTVAWRHAHYGGWPMTDPDGDTLYTRAGGMADRARAYDLAGGGERWTFTPASSNAWPEAATDDALAVTAITPETGAFNTVYAVDAGGEATAAFEQDGLFEAVGLGDTVYVADSDPGLRAFEP